MKLLKSASRACIYFFYDKNGIVDDYVLYALDELKKNVSYLHMVVNGNLSENSKASVLRVVDVLQERQNKGNDIGAYKDALEYIGWQKISAYDELIIMNFTCFGPVYPFDEVFQWANDQDIDLWGLTWDRKSTWMGDDKYLHWNEKPLFFQSYFCGIRKPLLTSKLIRDFYAEIPESATYLESGCFYEYAFPGYFEKFGYKSAVYCGDENDWNYPLLNNPEYLLKKYRMPLIKKRSFFHHYTDLLTNTGGEPTSRLIEYLKESTSYDVNLIIQSILRSCSLSDVVRCASLNRVIPNTSIYYIDDKKSKLCAKTGIVFLALNENCKEENAEVLGSLPDDIDLLLLTSDAELKDYYSKAIKKTKKNIEIQTIDHTADIVSRALFVYSKSFVETHAYICYVHDRQLRTDILYSIERSFDNRTKRIMIDNAEYVINILHLLENEEKLGVAFASAPNDKFYGDNIGNSWCGYFEATKEILGYIGNKSKIEEHSLCVAPVDSCLWFKADALKPLLEKYEEIRERCNVREEAFVEAIFRCCAYIAQGLGYYPCYLYNGKQVEVDLTNLELSKTGSTEMRAWIDLLAMDAIGFMKVENVFRKPKHEVTKKDAIVHYFPSLNSDRDVEYSIKDSMRLVSFAVRRKYPFVWKILAPLRFIGKKI